MFTASSAISVCRVWRMDEPTILRMCMSRIAARYSWWECRSGRRAISGWAPLRIAVAAVGGPDPTQQGGQPAKPCAAHQPLVATRSTDSRLKASGSTRQATLIGHSSPAPKS
jgi:predicted lysophospholipase L1 biosynthesis ABC-type transport system permease subunit